MTSKFTSNPTFCKAGGIVSTISIMIGIIVIGAITADNYGISQKTEKRSLENEERSIATQEFVNATSSQVNKTVTQLNRVFQALVDNDKHQQGNLTDHRIVANFTRDTVLELVNKTESETSQALINQEQFFKPYLNQTFSKIFKALNITE